MTERNETPTEPMTQSAAPCSEPNCIDMALAVLRSHPAATWRDEFSGLATDDLVIDRDMARHFADEASALRAENERLRSTVATLTAERDVARDEAAHEGFERGGDLLSLMTFATTRLGIERPSGEFSQRSILKQIESRIATLPDPPKGDE